MSTYITAEGTLQYKNREDFLAAKKILEDGGWLKNGFIVDECNDRLSFSDVPDVDEKGLQINIPFGLHRNLGWVLVADKVLKGNTGFISYTCTDGCCEAGEICGEKEEHFDLEKWAKENGYGDPPAIDAEDDEENQRQCDEFAEWLSDVEFGFMGKD